MLEDLDNDNHKNHVWWQNWQQLLRVIRVQNSDLFSYFWLAICFFISDFFLFSRDHGVYSNVCSVRFFFFSGWIKINNINVCLHFGKLNNNFFYPFFCKRKYYLRNIHDATSCLLFKMPGFFLFFTSHFDSFCRHILYLNGNK